MLTLLILAVVAFASTNIDDVFVLLTFFSDRSLKPLHVVLGQYLGIAALTAAAIVCSLASVVIPAEYIGLLGLLPILLGVRRLFWRKQPAESEKSSSGRGSQAGGVLSVALVTAANGGDNIAVYTPLLAGRPWLQILGFVGVFAAMTALWLGVARAVVAHPSLGPPIRRYGEALFPWVLIALGCYILFESHAYTLVGLGHGGTSK